jgi:tetratricopeptide (TPR) repeat protein
LTDLANSLINLSSRSEPQGIFYQALSYSKQGAGEIEKSEKIFNELAESPFIPIRAASLLALGMREIRREEYREAIPLVLQSAQLALSDNLCAPLTFIHAQNALSMILGANGAHLESIKVLESIKPLIYTAGRTFPALLGHFWNNQAYEYCQSENLLAASYCINKALRNPFVSRYPEWLETADEINSSLNIYSRSQIYVPDSEKYIPLPEKAENVAHVDFAGRGNGSSEMGEAARVLRYAAWAATWLEIYICIGPVMHLYETIPITVFGEDAEKMFIKLLTGLDEVSNGRETGEITIEAYLCSRKASALINRVGLVPPCIVEFDNLIEGLSDISDTSDNFHS